MSEKKKKLLLYPLREARWVVYSTYSTLYGIEYYHIATLSGKEALAKKAELLKSLPDIIYGVMPLEHWDRLGDA